SGLSVARLPERIDAMVSRDRIQPGRELGLALPLLRAPNHAEENLLHRVLSYGALGQHTQAEVVHTDPVTSEQSLERARVAFLVAEHELRVFAVLPGALFIARRTPALDRPIRGPRPSLLGSAALGRLFRCLAQIGFHDRRPSLTRQRGAHQPLRVRVLGRT